MKLTVVFPLYNEEALLPGLPDVMERIRAALTGHELSFLAVDDGSVDGTAAGLERIDGLRVVAHGRNRGVGAAQETGLLQAQGEAAVVYDPDEAYRPEDLAPLVRALEDPGADLVTLSPYHPEGGVEGVGPLRLWLSKTASALYRRRLRSRLHTFTCAVRAYRLDAVRPLLPLPADFTAAAFLIAVALRAGLRVIEVPARLHARRAGGSKMRVLRTIRAHLRLLRDLSVTGPDSNRETDRS